MIDFWFPKWINEMLVKYADNRQLSTEIGRASCRERVLRLV